MKAMIELEDSSFAEVVAALHDAVRFRTPVEVVYCRGLVGDVVPFHHAPPAFGDSLAVWHLLAWVTLVDARCHSPPALLCLLLWGRSSPMLVVRSAMAAVGLGLWLAREGRSFDGEVKAACRCMSSTGVVHPGSRHVDC